MACREAVTRAGPSRLRPVLGALLMAALGLLLLAMALLDARDLFQGRGTDRLTFSAGMFAYPWFGVTCLSFSAVIVHERVMSRAGSPRLARWTLIMGIVAIVSIPAAYVAGAVVAGRLEARGYSRCGDRFHSGRFSRDEWVRGGTACERDGFRHGAAHDPSAALVAQ